MWTILSIIAFLSSVETAMRTWDYTIHSIFANSTNEELCFIQCNISRVSRGVYAISGMLDIKTNFDETYIVKCEWYHSKSGAGKFKRTPLSIPKQNFNTFLATSYKHYIMNEAKKCSNLPQFDKESESVTMPPEKYWFKNCTFNPDDLPTYLPDGFYKLQIHLNGSVNVFLEMLFQVEPKIF